MGFEDAAEEEGVGIVDCAAETEGGVDPVACCFSLILYARGRGIARVERVELVG